MRDRFTRFNVGVSRLNKLINRLKLDGMEPLGLKAAHAMCIHQLACEDQLSFPQLCQRCDIDPALISRTLKELCASGHAEKMGQPGKYNAHYSLTDQGREVAGYIGWVVNGVIESADKGISEEELEVFYRVMEKLIANFERMTGERKNGADKPAAVKAPQENNRSEGEA